MFGVYNFVKYLMIRDHCTRVAMMVFYMVTFVCLTLRMVIMISLNWRAYFATENLLLSVVSLWAALIVGLVHMWNLKSLIIDLQTLSCLDRN